MSLNISGVITSDSAARSPLSYAPCSLRNCSFACSANGHGVEARREPAGGGRGCGIRRRGAHHRLEARGAAVSGRGSTRGDAPAPAPAPAYCNGRAGCARRDISMRTMNMPPTTSSASSMKLASDSDRPRCENSAARPSPAARPAIGSQPARTRRRRQAPPRAWPQVPPGQVPPRRRRDVGRSRSARRRGCLALGAQAAAAADALGVGDVGADQGGRGHQPHCDCHPFAHESCLR